MTSLIKSPIVEVIAGAAETRTTFSAHEAVLVKSPELKKQVENLAQNDFLTQDQRLQFQGIQGASVAGGSILGLMLGAVFVVAQSWQNLYWMQAGLAFVALVGIYFWVPAHKPCPRTANHEVELLIYSQNSFAVVNVHGLYIVRLLTS